MNFSKIEIDHTDIIYQAKDAKILLLLAIEEWTSKAIEAGISSQDEVNSWKNMLNNISDDDSSFFRSLTMTNILAWE